MDRSAVSGRPVSFAVLLTGDLVIHQKRCIILCAVWIRRDNHNCGGIRRSDPVPGHFFLLLLQFLDIQHKFRCSANAGSWRKIGKRLSPRPRSNWTFSLEPPWESPESVFLRTQAARSTDGNNTFSALPEESWSLSSNRRWLYQSTHVSEYASSTSAVFPALDYQNPETL